MRSDSDLQERSVEERTEIDMADIQDHCHSAPNSEQNDEEHVDVEAMSGEVNDGDQDNSDGQDREDDGNEGDEGDDQGRDEVEGDEGDDQGREASKNEEPNVREIVTVMVDSDSSEGRTTREKGGSKGEDSSTSFSSSSDSSNSGGEVGRFLVRGEGVLEEEQGENEQEVDALDSFNALGPREVDIAMRPAIELPRSYEDWVSPIVLNNFSHYRRGENMGYIISKINCKGMIFDVEGMEENEHVTTWPGSLKFAMYDIVVIDMHVRPPFTLFQQTALARLDIAPSQLHPNGWGFLRAFELVCLFLERPVSVDLFFHLFEVNRNNDGDEHRHVSLRAKRGQKVFRPYVESVQGRWSELFYYIVPLNDEAIRHVGKFRGKRLTV